MTALAGGAAGCSRAGAQDAGPPASRPVVAVAAVTRGDIAETLDVAAQFRAYQEIDVHAKVAGYLKSIPVDVGDRVAEGQLLAVLEIPELQDEEQQDEAAVKHAQAEIDRAQADIARAESAHDVAHANATRLSGVEKVRPNLVAQQDIDVAVGRDREAEAEVATAKAALAAAQDELDVAKADEDKTKTLFAYSRITAPFTGVITARYADTGAMIQAGTSSQTQALSIVRLSQNSRLRLVIPIPESAVSEVRVGTPVNLSVQALSKTFQGTVARFSDRLDADTRTMHVEVDVENPTLELVPGMYADVAVVLNAARNVVVAPVEAVDRAGNAARVFVVDARGAVEVRSVTLGLESAGRVEVASGLAPGDLAVVGNRSQLKAGALVSPKTVPTGGAEEAAH